MGLGMIIDGEKDNPQEVAYVQLNNERYEICARWNAAGKYRIIERLISREQALLFADQIRKDDQLRRRAMIETKDWDWINDKPREKHVRKPREKREPSPVFSFE